MEKRPDIPVVETPSHRLHTTSATLAEVHDDAVEWSTNSNPPTHSRPP